MAYATVDNIADDVIVRLSQVPGVSVQTYATPTIRQAIISHFRIVALEEWWEHLMYWQTFAVSAVTGVPTTDFSGLAAPVTEMRNIKAIYRTDSIVPIPKIHSRVLPTMVTGTTAKFYEPEANQTTLFRILPVTSTSAMTMRYRYVPSLPLNTSEVPFDREYMTLAGVYDYLEDDGGNPGQTEKFRHLLNLRMEQLVMGNNDHEIPLRADGLSVSIPNQWYES